MKGERGAFFLKKVHFLQLFRVHTCIFEKKVVPLHAIFENLLKIMHNFIQKVFLVCLVACLCVGCVTKKKLTYLRTVDVELADSINRHFVPNHEVTIKPSDELTIFISALDQEAVAPYNLPTASFNDPTTTQIKSVPMLLTYRVDSNGDVELPVLGKMHVEGLVRKEVEELVKHALEQQVLNPIVQVNLMNAKVAVLGEVNKPGSVSISDGRLTILDALAAVGDMTPYGRRDNVLLTREVDGKLEFARIDITSPELLMSPYYYLQQNDVLYVSPNSVRAINSANVSLWLSMVSTVASAATVIVTVINATK